MSATPPSEAALGSAMPSASALKIHASSRPIVKGAWLRLMFASYLEPGDVVLDIGANVGHYTKKYAQRVGPTGAVYAVEPSHLAIEVLRNEMCPAYPWVISFEIALADTAGVRPFYTACGDTQRSSLWVNNLLERDDPPTSEPVFVTTLDTLMTTLPRCPKLIKVDAQGAEAAILAGATKTLSYPIAWALELWPMGLENAGASVADVLAHFQSRGFAACMADGRPWPGSWDAVAGEAAGHSGHGSIDVVCRPA